MTDYTFMRSGFDQIQTETEEDVQKNVISLITFFTENALNSASIYIKHGKRNCIVAEDIKRSLMLETLLFGKRENSAEKIEKIKKELFDEEEEEIIGEEKEELSPDEFKLSECGCAMCSCLNTIHEKWGKWEPSSSLELIIKKQIDEIPTN